MSGPLKAAIMSVVPPQYEADVDAVLVAAGRSKIDWMALLAKLGPLVKLLLPLILTFFANVKPTAKAVGAIDWKNIFAMIQAILAIFAQLFPPSPSPVNPVVPPGPVYPVN
jgi:hypothetical protein